MQLATVIPPPPCPMAKFIPLPFAKTLNYSRRYTVALLQHAAAQQLFCLFLVLPVSYP
jgi:hypothetical protein